MAQVLRLRPEHTLCVTDIGSSSSHPVMEEGNVLQELHNTPDMLCFSTPREPKLASWPKVGKCLGCKEVGWGEKWHGHLGEEGV